MSHLVDHCMVIYGLYLCFIFVKMNDESVQDFCTSTQLHVYD